MKRIRVLNSCIICLFALCIAFLNASITSFADEDDNIDLSFNSVVEVESYSIEEEYIEAGKQANITLTLKNANRNSAANNLVVVVSSTSGMIYPLYGNDNQFYVGTLEANSTTDVNIPIIVDSAFNGEFVDFICSIAYVAAGKQITNTSTMVLPAKGNNTILVNAIDLSAHATVNGNSLLSISYYNKGTKNIDDAVLVIDGNVNDSVRNIELGVIAAGKSYSNDYNIIFTEAGEQTVTIKIRYSDTDGELVEEEIGTYKVTVGWDNNSASVATEENTVLVWIGRVIALLGVLGVVIVGWLYIKKR